MRKKDPGCKRREYKKYVINIRKRIIFVISFLNISKRYAIPKQYGNRYEQAHIDFFSKKMQILLQAKLVFAFEHMNINISLN